MHELNEGIRARVQPEDRPAGIACDTRVRRESPENSECSPYKPFVRPGDHAIAIAVSIQKADEPEEFFQLFSVWQPDWPGFSASDLAGMVCDRLDEAVDPLGRHLERSESC